MPTNKTGAITANETWGESPNEGPIHMTGQVVVNAGVTLRILPGTVVVAKGDFDLRVIGMLSAGGTRRSRIVLRSDSGARGAWTGIRLKGDVLSGGSLIEFCDILDAHAGVWFDDEQSSGGAAHQVIATRFKNCKAGILWEHQFLGASRCVFEDNLYGISFVGATVTNVDSPTSLNRRGVLDSRFRGNDVGLNVDATSTVTISDARNRLYRNRVAAAQVAGTLNAESTWWGSDTGPSGSKGVTGGLGDAITGAGTVDVTPWTELLRYVPESDDLRTLAGQIMELAGAGGEYQIDAVLADEDLDRILDRAQGTIDSWHTDRKLPKPLFARGTETNEQIDVDGAYGMYGVKYYPVRYRPIRAITSVDRRLGVQWDPLANDEWQGWFVSDDLLDTGYIHIRTMPYSPMAAFRVTYDHGYNTMPQAVRDMVLKVALLDVFQAVIPPGSQDPLAARKTDLRAEVQALEKRVRSDRVAWST